MPLRPISLIYCFLARTNSCIFGFSIQGTIYILFFLLMVCVGCVPYKVPTEELIEEVSGDNCDDEGLRKALEHPLYKIVPRHHCQLYWYDIGHWSTWALFGNDDDGIFGEGPSACFELEKEVSYGKAVRWLVRNPFHNFTFYVIGTAGACNSELDLLRVTESKVSSGNYRKCGMTNFASETGSSLYIALHGWKPYISLSVLHSKDRRSEFYLGWRSRGNFGFKCLPFRKLKR